MKTFLLFLALLTTTGRVLAHEPSPEFKPVKLVVSIDDNGPTSKNIVLKKQDGSIFFINSSKESEVHVEVGMGSRTKHCWTPNMEIKENGNLGTANPLKPNDFALLCFPEAGAYDVMITSKQFDEVVKVTVKADK